ncbi:MAG: hypothetical protein Q4G62_07075 [Pseudomonadota bacterium]|nr:hypothetical protein [Pseudomonadota bacterium]
MDKLPINLEALGEIPPWTLLPLFASLAVIWGWRAWRRWTRYRFEHHTLSGSMTLTEISGVIGSGPYDTKSAPSANPPLEELLIHGKTAPVPEPADAPPPAHVDEASGPTSSNTGHDAADASNSSSPTSHTLTIGAGIAPADLPAANENEAIDPLMAAYMELLAESRPDIYDAWSQSAGKDLGSDDDAPPPRKVAGD